MHNNLDKQPVKQNTPIVAIGGCGQDDSHIFIISNLRQFVKHNEIFDVWGAGEEIVALGVGDLVFFLE